MDFVQLPDAIAFRSREYLAALTSTLPGDTSRNPSAKIPSLARGIAILAREQIPAPQQLNSKTVALMNRAFFNYEERVRNKF